jgi:hypothetical protein
MSDWYPRVYKLSTQFHAIVYQFTLWAVLLRCRVISLDELKNLVYHVSRVQPENQVNNFQ